jgi:hypothetical protein
MSTILVALVARLLFPASSDASVSGDSRGAESETASLERRGASSGSGPITLEDIETRLRSLSGTATAAVDQAKTTIVPIGIAGGFALLGLVYLLGRRRGRRRATVLEIHRV